MILHLPQGILSHCSLGSKACNSPHSDLHPSEELFTPHVPNSSVGQSLLLAGEQTLGKIIIRNWYTSFQGTFTLVKIGKVLIISLLIPRAISCAFHNPLVVGLLSEVPTWFCSSASRIDTPLQSYDKTTGIRRDVPPIA